MYLSLLKTKFVQGGLEFRSLRLLWRRRSLLSASNLRHRANTKNRGIN